MTAPTESSAGLAGLKEPAPNLEAGDDVSNRPAPKPWKTAIRTTLTIAMLAGMAWYLWQHRDDAKVLLSLGWWWIAGLLVLQVVTNLLYFAKFKLVVGHYSERPMDSWRVFEVFSIGGVLSLLLAQGGNVYRAVAMKKEFGISHTHFVGAFLAMAWLDAVLTYALAGIGILLGQGSANEKIVIESILCLCLVVLVAGPWLSYRVLQRLRLRSPWMCRMQERLVLMHESLWRLVGDRRLLLRFLVLDICSFAVIAGTAWASFASINVYLDLLPLMVIFWLQKLSTLVQLTPGNLGLREAMLGLAGQGLGLNPPLVVLASLIGRVTSQVALLLVCVPALGGVFRRFGLKRH